MLFVFFAVSLPKASAVYPLLSRLCNATYADSIFMDRDSLDEEALLEILALACLKNHLFPDDTVATRSRLVARSPDSGAFDP